MSSRHSDVLLPCAAGTLGLLVVLHNIIRSFPDNHVYMCASFFGICGMRIHSRRLQALQYVRMQRYNAYYFVAVHIILSTRNFLFACNS